MRVSHFAVSLVLISLLTACGKKAPESTTTAEANAPRPVAEQEKEIAARLAEQKKALDEQTSKDRDSADRIRRVKLVADMGRNWSSAVNEVRAAPRSKLAEPIAKMEALRNEAQAMDTDSCTAPARDTLVRAMNTMIDAVKAFQSQGTGDQTEAVTKATTESQNLFGESNKQLLACN